MRKPAVIKEWEDPTVLFSELKIDARVFRLAYRFSDIRKAELLCGADLLHGVARLLMNAPTATQLSGLLYAAMRLAHPETTMDQTDSLVRIDTIPDIQEAILRAYNLSLPEEKKILNPTVAESVA